MPSAPGCTPADEGSSAGVFCVSHAHMARSMVEEIGMFDTLSDRLGSVFDRLRGRGALTEGDVRAAMREVRVALLEADVALPVARDFVEQVTEKAVGQEVLRSVTPGQMVVKYVHDALVETLGAETAELN